MQGLGFRLPIIERARDANGLGRWMAELKADGHHWRRRRRIVMIVIMFHGMNQLRGI